MLFGVVFLLLVPSQYMKIVQDEARRHGLDPLLVAAVIHKESQFNPNACYRGSHGLMQIQLKSRSCSGSMELAVSSGLYEPRTNIRKGIRLLKIWKRWWERHHSDSDFHWLLFYNQGFGKCPDRARRCETRLRVPIRSGKIGGYADRVLKIYEKLKKKYR